MAADLPVQTPAEQFINRIAAPGATRAGHYTTMINSLVSAGVFAKLDGLYMFAAASQATALTNIISSLYSATAFNSPTFTTDVGFAGNGSNAYIRANVDLTLAANWRTQSACMFSFENSFGDGSNSLMFDPGIGGFTYLFGRAGDQNAYGAINSDGVQMGLPCNPAGPNLWHINRNGTGNGSQQYYKGGASLGTGGGTATPQAPNAEVYIFGSGGAVSDPRQQCCVGFGGSLSAGEAAALYAAIHVYLQNVAGVA